MDETWHWHESINEVENKDRFFSYIFQIEQLNDISMK